MKLEFQLTKSDPTDSKEIFYFTACADTTIEKFVEVFDWCHLNWIGEYECDWEYQFTKLTRQPILIDDASFIDYDDISENFELVLETTNKADAAAFKMQWMYT